MFNSASKREQRMLAYYAEREQNRRSQWLKAFSTKIAIVLYLPLSSSIYLTKNKKNK